MNDVPPSPPQNPRQQRRWLPILATTTVCLLILAASAAAVVAIHTTEPTAQQIETTRKSAALVETLTVQRGTYSPNIVVLGVVEPAQEVALSPRVSGQVIELSPQFAPGETVRKGDLLLRIDPADFQNALSISQSELAQIEASLEIEKGRQILAQTELALLEETIDEANRALVLRKPQIDSIYAQIAAAQAEVERAKVDLERTRITAPFDAHILSRAVNVGSQVAPGDELGQLVGVEEYWIMASVPVRSLRWVQFPESEGQGSAVTLRDPDTWPPGAERRGAVARMIGALDQQTRLARILITVDDPLGRNTDDPPLLLGSMLETHIEGRPIENVVRLSRDYVREGDTVWVMQDGKLDIREVEIVFRDADHAYIQEGLEDGDEVVTTTLATVAEGIGLKKVNDPAEPNDREQGENANAEAAE